MNPAGIYIHIPFCRSHCSYCDFATGMYTAALAQHYVPHLAKEIKSFGTVEKPSTVDTIFFGGGTPSLLTSAQLETILNAVLERFAVSSGAEVTMEMNPGTVAPETLSAYRNLGVNRASFGAQTFDDNELARLGRSHTADDRSEEHTS